MPSPRRLGIATALFVAACSSNAPSASPHIAASASAVASVAVTVSPAPTTATPAPGRIVFRVNDDPHDDSNLYLVNADGTGLTQLTHGSNARYEYPTWTPDGGRILYDIEDASGSHIFSMDSSGGSVHQLTFGAQDDKAPDMSPDGRLIAFVDARSIYLMRADGSHITRVTTPAAGVDGDSEPDISPDGLSIAFARGGAIDVVGIDGSHLREVAPASANALRPRWSPDGTKLLFSNPGDQSVGEDLHVVNADGSGLVNLTSGFGNAGDAAWSPDGQWVAFGLFHIGNHFVGLAVMHPDGTDLTYAWRPADFTNDFPSDPAWAAAP